MAGWLWGFVVVDLAKLGDKSERVNVTLPHRVLRAIDTHARRHGETRSGFLARAALNQMRREAAARGSTSIVRPLGKAAAGNGVVQIFRVLLSERCHSLHQAGCTRSGSVAVNEAFDLPVDPGAGTVGGW